LSECVCPASQDRASRADACQGRRSSHDVIGDPTLYGAQLATEIQSQPMKGFERTLAWLFGLSMGGGLTYFAIRFARWHSATKSILGMLVFLFYTGISLFMALFAVMLVVVTLRELFCWKLEDDLRSRDDHAKRNDDW
jgi:uncharacterized membrane protein